jgi:hypothetical protein
VESLVAQVCAGTRCVGCLVPAGLKNLADHVARLVVPGGLDEQPSDVAVAGLGDASLAA